MKPITDGLPELPTPWDYAYVWDGPHGTRKFDAAHHNGRACDNQVLLFTADQMRDYAAQAVAAERTQKGLIIDNLLRGITDARCLMAPIWRQRMGAEQVLGHVQRGMRRIDSAITDCGFRDR